MSASVEQIEQQQQKIAAQQKLWAAVVGGTEPDADEPNDEPEAAAQPILLTAERVAELKARPESQIPEWKTPSHEEIDLATVSHEDLGLDPYDYDNPLVRKIYETQIQAETVSTPEPLTSFEQRALPLIARNVPVIPLRPNSKIAFTKGWENLATTDPAQVKQWSQDNPEANVASVAKAQPGGVWFFDADRSGLAKRIELETGYKIPSTFMVRSQPGKGHYYFLQNAASIAMGNRQAKDQQGELWSARVDDRYVVGPLSVHPDTGKLYEVFKDVPIVEAPQWLIDYCIQNDANTQQKTGHVELDSEEPIAEGSRNSTLASIAGKARQVLAMDKEQLFTYLLSVNAKRCEPPLPESEVRTIANSIDRYEVKDNTPVPVKIGGYTAPVAETIPVIDDPSDDDPRFEMKGDFFDTKVYENISQKFTEYPNPGNGDLISMLSNKLVHGTSIPLAYTREPLKAIILHVLDGKLIHPAHPKLSLRGNYFSLGESETGKTTGLEFAIQAAEILGSSAHIHFENLFRYKSETTFIRSFTPEGTIKRDANGNIKSGAAGHPSQFLFIKEGNLVAHATDYFAAVFAMLTNLYDQTEAGTESMTNGNFTARSVKASTVMCFTLSDHTATFGGKGNIGGGGLNRWAMVNPPPIHDYDNKDWERLSDEEIQQAVGQLATQVFNLRYGGNLSNPDDNPIVLTEEPGAARIRLEVKQMLKKAGKVGKRLMDYFMREQVAQAATAVDGRLVMTTEQALYAKKWVEAQLACRMQCWPSDANNQIEAMEHAIRKAVTTHHVSESKLKDVCHLYREGSGGWFVYSSALKNMVASGVIKRTGKTRKGAKTYCPGSCAVHSPVKDE